MDKKALKAASVAFATKVLPEAWAELRRCAKAGPQEVAQSLGCLIAAAYWTGREEAGRVSLAEAKLSELREAHDALSKQLKDPDAGNDEVREAALEVCNALNEVWPYIEAQGIIPATEGQVPPA